MRILTVPLNKNLEKCMKIKLNIFVLTEHQKHVFYGITQRFHAKLKVPKKIHFYFSIDNTRTCATKKELETNMGPIQRNILTIPLFSPLAMATAISFTAGETLPIIAIEISDTNDENSLS